MGKTRSKFLTFLIVFSMIMSMGVSFGAKDVGTEEEIIEDPTGKLNIMIDDDALVELGLTMTLTHEDGESFEVPTDGDKWQDAPYGEYDVVLNLSSEDILESFYVVVRQKGKPNETFDTPTFTIDASAATVFLEDMDIVLGEVETTGEYIVEHYKETEYNSGVYELEETDDETGTIGDEVTAVAKTYTDYTENTTHEDRVPSGTVLEDGSLVLELYYDADEPDPTTAEYIVEHYKETEYNSGVYELEETDDETGTIDDEVTAVAKTYTDYTENTNHEDRVPSGTVLEDGSLVLELYYDADEPDPTTGEYIVEHYKETEYNSGVYELEETDDETGTIGDEVTAVAKTYTDYTENTTHEDRVPSGTVLEDGSLVLELYYDADEPDPTTAEYIVEHYKETEYNSGVYELEETDDETGTIGDEVTAVAKTYTDYTENTTHEDRVPSGTVLEDGSLVLELYYDADEDEQEEPEEDTWTVTFLPGNRGDLDGQTVFEDIEDESDWDDVIDVPDVDPDSNYRFDGWSDRFPDTINKDWVFVAEYERIERDNERDNDRDEVTTVEIDEPIVLAPPAAQPVVTPQVETPVEVVEVPVEVPAAVPTPATLPKTGSVGAGEMAGFGALLMAIGILLGKKKEF